MDQRVRDLSHKLFGGGQYRLEVGAAIQAGELVTIKDLAEELGDPPGSASVNVELKILESIGLLTRLPKVSGDRRVFLLPIESPYWSACRQLAEFARAGAMSGRPV